MLTRAAHCAALRRSAQTKPAAQKNARAFFRLIDYIISLPQDCYTFS
jgi:hypothetical protein